MTLNLTELAAEEIPMNFRPMIFDKEISESSKLIGFLNGMTYAIESAAVLQKPWTCTERRISKCTRY
jgi:hypothetical protein